MALLCCSDGRCVAVNTLHSLPHARTPAQRRRCFWVRHPERVVVRSAPPLVGTKTRTVTGATKPAHPKGRTGLASSHLTSRRKLPHEGRKSLCRSGYGQRHLGGGLGPRALD